MGWSSSTEVHRGSGLETLQPLSAQHEGGSGCRTGLQPGPDQGIILCFSLSPFMVLVLILISSSLVAALLWVQAGTPAPLTVTHWTPSEPNTVHPDCSLSSTPGRARTHPHTCPGALGRLVTFWGFWWPGGRGNNGKLPHKSFHNHLLHL